MNLSVPRLLVSVAASVAVLVGATFAVDRSINSSSEPVAAAPAPEGASTLTIASFVYNPTPLMVKPGATIAVTNQDKAKHTVTSGTRDSPDGQFDAKLDASAAGTFTAPAAAGSYPYICTIHPGMKGTIEVAP